MISSFQNYMGIDEVRNTHPQSSNCIEISVSSIFFFQIVALWSLVTLTNFPQLDGFVW